MGLHADDYIYSLDIENSTRPPRWLCAQVITRAGGEEAAKALVLDKSLIFKPVDKGEPDRSHYPAGLCDRIEYIAVQWLRWADGKGLSWKALPDLFTTAVNSIALSRCKFSKSIPASELTVPASKYREQGGFQWAHGSWGAVFGYLFEICSHAKQRKKEGKLRPAEITIAIHNLSYEGSFMIPWLLDNGFTYGKEAQQFEAITDGTKIYNLTVRSEIGGRVCSLNFVCTLCMTGLALSVAAGPKGYNLPTKKASGDLDYTIFREMGDPFTTTETGYITGDVDSTVELLRYLRFNGMDSLTAASHALKTLCTHAYYAAYSGDICPDDMHGAKEYEQRVKDFLRDNKLTPNKCKRSMVGGMIPKPTRAEDELMRLAYDGGFVAVNPKHRGKWVTTRNYDVNSEFPAAMVKYKCPGRWTVCPGNETGDGLYINYFTVTALHLKDGMPPMLPSGGSHNGIGKRLSDWEAVTEPEYVDIDSFPRDKAQRANGYWALCTYDFNHMWECYEVSGYKPAFCLKFTPLFNVCFNFVKCFYALKAYHHTTGESGARANDKLLLNSSYGKFASRFLRDEFNFGVDEEGALTLTKNGEQSEGGVNVAIGLFITGAARDILYKGIKEVGWDRVAYSDTDSMKVISDDGSDYSPEIDDRIGVSETEIGAWKFEGFTRSVFLNPKQYTLITEGGKIETGAAGYDKEYIASMGEAYTLQPYAWTQQSMKVSGGRVIIPKVKARALPGLEEAEDDEI